MCVFIEMSEGWRTISAAGAISQEIAMQNQGQQGIRRWRLFQQKTPEPCILYNLQKPNKMIRVRHDSSASPHRRVPMIILEDPAEHCFCEPTRWINVFHILRLGI